MLIFVAIGITEYSMKNKCDSREEKKHYPTLVRAMKALVKVIRGEKNLIVRFTICFVVIVLV